MVDLGPAERATLGREEMAFVEARCLCPTCPAYPEADRGEKKTYCMRGDSAHKAQIEPKDCLCELCEVYKHSRLYGANFFCLEGAALKKGLRNILEGNVISKWSKEDAAAVPVFLNSGGALRRGGEDDA